MNLYTVTPIRYGVKAPAMFIESSNKRGAFDEAKSRSGLFRFKSWRFDINEVRKIEEKKSRRQKDESFH